MNPYEELIERMCAASWNAQSSRLWSEIPEVWKPFYRTAMQAAHAAMVNGIVEAAQPEQVQ